AAIAWLSAPARFDGAKTDIRVDYDKTFSFVGLRTWTWHPDGAGDVRLAVSSYDDPKKVASRVDPIIIPTVEREMPARGLARAADGISDALRAAGRAHAVRPSARRNVDRLSANPGEAAGARGTRRAGSRTAHFETGETMNATTTCSAAVVFAVTAAAAGA